VRELVTAPKLRIRPHRVAVVLTTRVTGDLRLLRILAIDSGTISAHRSGDVAAVKIRFGLSGQVLWPRHPRVRPRFLETGFAPTDYALDLSCTTKQRNRRAGTETDALARLEREPGHADTAAPRRHVDGSPATTTAPPKGWGWLCLFAGSDAVATSAPRPSDLPRCGHRRSAATNADTCRCRRSTRATGEGGAPETAMMPSPVNCWTAPP
jgi:hypothetical protein